MSVQLILDRDSTSAVTTLRPLGDGTNVFNVQLAADVATSLAVPASARKVVFSSELDFWVGTATFTLPAGAAFAVSAENVEQDPAGYYFSPGSVANLWFRAQNQTRINVSFYT